MRFVLVALLLAGFGKVGTADEPPDPYDRLYDIIMVRTVSDERVVTEDPDSPLLWKNSRYLLSEDTLPRLLKSLDDLNSLTGDRIEAYPPLNRAILQHHLWTVFDWTTLLDLSRGDTNLPPSQLHKMQKSLALAIRKLALSETAIAKLPNPLTATADSEKFPKSYDASDSPKPFLPSDLFDEKGPWVCLSKDGHAVPAIVHTEAVAVRSAFLIFMRLPDGREATLKYLETLAAFRSPWVSGGQPPHVGIPQHPSLITMDVHDNPLTPQFPVGTQVALLQQALLIADSGQLILSPLVQRVQLRAYLNVNVDRRRNNRVLGPSQAISEFVLQPREMMQGNVPMRPIAANEIHYTTIFASSDLIERPETTTEAPTVPRLQTCITCHSGSGIHSINSRFELFQDRSLVPPRFAVTTSDEIGSATARMKGNEYAWGLLQGLWRD